MEEQKLLKHLKKKDDQGETPGDVPEHGEGFEGSEEHGEGFEGSEEHGEGFEGSEEHGDGSGESEEQAEGEENSEVHEGSPEQLVEEDDGLGSAYSRGTEQGGESRGMEATGKSTLGEEISHSQRVQEKIPEFLVAEEDDANQGITETAQSSPRKASLATVTVVERSQTKIIDLDRIFTEITIVEKRFHDLIEELRKETHSSEELSSAFQKHEDPMDISVRFRQRQVDLRYYLHRCISNHEMETYPTFITQLKLSDENLYQMWWCHLTEDENKEVRFEYKMTIENWVIVIPNNARNRHVIVVEDPEESGLPHIEFSRGVNSEKILGAMGRYKLTALSSNDIVLLRYILNDNKLVTVVLRYIKSYTNDYYEPIIETNYPPYSTGPNIVCQRVVSLFTQNGSSTAQRLVLFEPGENSKFPVCEDVSFEIQDIFDEDQFENVKHYMTRSQSLQVKMKKKWYFASLDCECNDIHNEYVLSPDLKEYCNTRGEIPHYHREESCDLPTEVGATTSEIVRRKTLDEEELSDCSVMTSVSHATKIRECRRSLSTESVSVFNDTNDGVKERKRRGALEDDLKLTAGQTFTEEITPPKRKCNPDIQTEKASYAEDVDSKDLFAKPRKPRKRVVSKREEDNTEISSEDNEQSKCVVQRSEQMQSIDPIPGPSGQQEQRKSDQTEESQTQVPPGSKNVSLSGEPDEKIPKESENEEVISSLPQPPAHSPQDSALDTDE